MKHNHPVVLAVLCSAVALLAAPAWAEATGAAALPTYLTLSGQTLAHGNAIAADTLIHRVETPLLHLVRTHVPSPKGVILLCPGGGYFILAAGHEGTATAAFLNDQGFDVAILEYTISAGPNTRNRALADALAAWRLIKAKAAKLGLHDGQFGVMGYSAGGHLAARLTSFLAENELPDDVILVYPAYLNETLQGTRVAAIRPPAAATGRLFVTIAANDNADWVSSCREYSAVWKANGGKARLEILKDGGHGFGIKKDLPGDARRWPDLLADFLRAPLAAGPEVNPAEAAVSQGCADRHRQKCAAVAKQKFNLILIGDSITHNFERPEYQGVWNQFFAPRRRSTWATPARAPRTSFGTSRTASWTANHPRSSRS